MYKGLRKEGVIQLTKNGVAFGEASRWRKSRVSFVLLMLRGGALQQNLSENAQMFKRFSKPKKKNITLCNLIAV